MVSKLLTFKMRQQQPVAKKNGRIDVSFGKVVKGRPVAIKIGSPLPMNQTAKMVLGSSKKKRGGANTHVKWNLLGDVQALKTAVIIDIARRKKKGWRLMWNFE